MKPSTALPRAQLATDGSDSQGGRDLPSWLRSRSWPDRLNSGRARACPAGSPEPGVQPIGQGGATDRRRSPGSCAGASALDGRHNERVDLRRPIAWTCTTCALAGLLPLREPSPHGQQVAWLPQAVHGFHAPHVPEPYYSPIVRVSNVTVAPSSRNYTLNAEPGTYTITGYDATLVHERGQESPSNLKS